MHFSFMFNVPLDRNGQTRVDEVYYNGSLLRNSRMVIVQSMKTKHKQREIWMRDVYHNLRQEITRY